MANKPGVQALIIRRTVVSSFLLFASFTINYGQSSGNLKKELNDLPGTWYGEFSWRIQPDIYQMTMNIDEASKNKISGSFHWPDYFNSLSAVQGEFSGQTIDLWETRLLQGVDMDFEGVYRIRKKEGDTLRGVWLNQEGKERADFWLLKADHYPREQLQQIEARNKNHAEKFGAARIFPLKENIEADEIFRLYLENNPQEDSINKTMEATGTVVYSNVEMPIYVAFKFPDKFYLRLEAMNKHFLFAKSGDIVWEYNPITDQLKLKPGQAGDDDNFAMLQTGVQDLKEQGYVPTLLQEAEVNGIEAYRIVLEKEGIRNVCFISKNDYLLIRTEKEDEIVSLSDYRKAGQMNIPYKIEMVNEEEHNTFLFEQFHMNPDIKDDLFKIPEELKGKQVRENKKGHGYYYELGQQKHSEGAYEEAVEAYSTAISLYPNHALYHYQRGITKSEKEDYYGAISDFSMAAEIDPYFKEAYNHCGLAKYSLGDYQSAIKDFERAIGLDSMYEDPYFNRGSAYYHMNNPEKSLEDFDWLVSTDSTNARYLYNKGLVLAELENFDEAIRHYQAALSYESDNGYLLNHLGVAHYGLGQFEEAAESFRKAIQIDSGAYIRHQNLGNAYYNMGKFGESLQAYELALELDPENDNILNDIGLSYYYRGMNEEAVQYIARAIELNSKNAAYFDNRAMARAQLMDYTGAIDDYGVSLSLYPDDSEIYYRRGILKALINDNFDACRDFKRALDLGHEKAQEKIDEHCNFSKQEDSD